MVAVAKRKTIDPAFGRRLRELREQAGLTQAQLGERAGMLYQTVAKLERAEREPTWQTFIKLADALGVDLNTFRGQTAGLAGEEASTSTETPPRPMGKRK